MLSTRMGRRALDFRISFNASRPLRPGIVTSRMTTSHSSFQTRSMASCALLASPNVARRYSSARICFKPCLTTAWSSAIRILMDGRTGVARLGPGDSHGDKGSMAWFALDFDMPAEQRRPLLHAEQPDRPAVAHLAGGNAAAVVLHGEHEL